MNKNIKQVIVVRFNDKFGYGIDKDIEVVVDSHRQFAKRLKERNKEKRKEDPECGLDKEEEFDLIPVSYITYE